MKLFNRFRLSIHRFFLQKKIRKHQYSRQLLGYHKISYIGVLIFAPEKDQLDTALEYVQQLRSSGKKVDILIFNGSREKLSDGLLFLTSKDLNWYLKPVSDAAGEFLKKDFDLLLNLSTKECVPLEYILALSRAKFRVGKFFSEKTQFYDFMINLNGNASIEELIKETDHFLKKINQHEQ